MKEVNTFVKYLHFNFSTFNFFFATELDLKNHTYFIKNEDRGTLNFLNVLLMNVYYYFLFPLIQYKEILIIQRHS
jgi:hypothetical protein